MAIFCKSVILLLMPAGPLCPPPSPLPQKPCPDHVICTPAPALKMTMLLQMYMYFIIISKNTEQQEQQDQQQLSNF